MKVRISAIIAALMVAVAGPAVAQVTPNTAPSGPTQASALMFLDEVARSGSLAMQSIAHDKSYMENSIIESVKAPDSPCRLEFMERGVRRARIIDLRIAGKLRLIAETGKVVIPWTNGNGQDELISPTMAQRIFNAVTFLEKSCKVQIKSGTGF